MYNKNIAATFALVAVALPGLSLGNIATAQTFEQSSSQSVRERLLPREYSSRIGFVPPLESGTPRRTRSGATRDLQCGGTALVPASGLGLTTEARPLLHMYVEPSVQKLLLTVEGIDDDYTKEVALSGEGGIVEVSLPETVKALEIGEEYSWSLIMICGEALRPDSPIVAGDIRRVESIFTPSQAQSISLAEQASAYGDAGVWHDLISTLTTMRLDNPEDTQVQTHWESVLEVVGLSALADEPFLR
ncbi:MAG: DUF928 domain-containing protein [Leptolyngbyaceae cyanobacterium MAG.088]|nr:DUF928 domain-containing protein [Leptolyngbyaceae cyanobacterium MAG.088]